MRAYLCDWCRKPRQEGESWILGFAAERVGAFGVQREFSVAAGWSDRGAEHPLAVHFCCEAHKGSYMAALFGRRRKTRTAAAAHGRAVAASRNPGDRGTRQKSSSLGTVSLGGSIGSALPENKAISHIGGAAHTTKRERVPRAAFNEADEIRSRGLSVQLSDGAAEAWRAET